MSVISEINMMVKRAEIVAPGTGSRNVVKRTWKGMANDPNRPAWVGDALSRVESARMRAMSERMKAMSGAKKTTPAAQTTPQPVQQTPILPKARTAMPQQVQQTPTTQQTAGGTTASAAARMKEYKAIRARMLRDYVNRTGSSVIPPEYMKKIYDAQEAYMNGK